MAGAGALASPRGAARRAEALCDREEVPLPWRACISRFHALCEIAHVALISSSHEGVCSAAALTAEAAEQQTGGKYSGNSGLAKTMGPSVVVMGMDK